MPAIGTSIQSSSKGRKQTTGIPSSEFLDSNQYTNNGILRYEFVFGRHFISTGGLESTEAVTKHLDLKPNERVLDAGSGLGGSAFYMAREHGVFVDGIDLSHNMLENANSALLEQSPEVQERVTFRYQDLSTMVVEPETYDVIYSRDCFIHIGIKEEIFRKFFDWLKPGGRFLVTDYCTGETLTPSFAEYIKQRDYSLFPFSKYSQLINDIFPRTKIVNLSDKFVDILKDESKKLARRKESFLEKFTEDDYSDLMDGWEDKIAWTTDGTMQWGLFIGFKN